MTQPLDALTTPVAEDPLPGAVAFVAGGNFVSPAFYISQVIQWATNGFDPFGWASEQVTGDWEKVKQAGIAATNLATFNTTFRDSVKSGWQNDIESNWRGNAADSARGYFYLFGDSVDYQAGSLGEIGRTLNNIADSMMNLSRVVGDLLQDIADHALLAGIALAAGATLSSSLVGSPAAGAAYAVAAAEMALIAVRVNKMMSTVTNVYKAIVALCAAAEELSSRISDKLPPLPTTAYDHPGA